jgi:protein-S-isoprenylcysteine O-methyltransferase Ste14
MSTNLYAPPKAPVADVVQAEAAPALWNPGAAASWSLLFSPAFGAFLHMKNWEALGQPDKAAAARKWAVIYIVTIVGLSVVSAFLPSNKAMPGIVLVVGVITAVAAAMLKGT